MPSRCNWLSPASGAVRPTVRPTVCCRWRPPSAGSAICAGGAAEFLVALPKADLEGAASRLRRVLERVQESVRAGVQPVSFSCGIALVSAEGLDRGLADADRALWQAKRQGQGSLVTAE